MSVAREVINIPRNEPAARHGKRVPGKPPTAEEIRALAERAEAKAKEAKKTAKEPAPKPEPKGKKPKGRGRHAT